MSDRWQIVGKDGSAHTCKTTASAGALTRQEATKLLHNNLTGLLDLELENARGTLGRSCSGIILRQGDLFVNR
jgi:hypothetical protein